MIKVRVVDVASVVSVFLQPVHDKLCRALEVLRVPHGDPVLPAEDVGGNSGGDARGDARLAEFAAE